MEFGPEDDCVDLEWLKKVSYSLCRARLIYDEIVFRLHAMDIQSLKHNSD